MIPIFLRPLDDAWFASPTVSIVSVDELNVEVDEITRSLVPRWIRKIERIINRLYFVPCEGQFTLFVTHCGYRAKGALFVFDSDGATDASEILTLLHRQLDRSTSITHEPFRLRISYSIKVSEVYFPTDGASFDFEAIVACDAWYTPRAIRSPAFAG